MNHRLSRGWLAAVAVAVAAAMVAAPAFSAPDIAVGQLSPFTNLPVPEASELNQGSRAFFNGLNKAGGIRDRKVTLIEFDDRYSADGFAEQFPKAMEKKVVALLNPIGSPAIKRMLDDKMLDSADVVVLNAIPGAEALRNPGHSKFFHLRAGDKQQIEKIINHARTLGMTRLSVLYQDIPIGTSGWDVAQKEVATAKGIEIKGVKSNLELPQVAIAAKEVAAQGPQGVLITGAPRFTVDAIAALRKAGVTQSIFVLSYVQPGLLIKVAGLEAARGVGISQTYPNANGRVLPLMRDFQAAMKASYPEIQFYTPFHLEGYLAARTLGEALKRSKDTGELTGASVARSLKAMGELDFGGFRVNFTKSNIGSTFVDIGVIGSDGKLRY
ncbi:MAG: ABC transporter substrate-binding protein [Polaromonas sp.]